MPNDIDWVALDALDAKRTPGPWKVREYVDEKWDEHQLSIDADDKPVGTMWLGNAVWLAEGESEANAAFIVAGVNAYPAIKAERERLLEQLRLANVDAAHLEAERNALADENRQLRGRLEQVWWYPGVTDILAGGLKEKP